MSEPLDATGPAVGVDVGGTKIAAGLVGGDGTVHRRVRVDSPAADSGEMTDAIGAAVDALGADGAVIVGVGAAGIVDLSGTVRYSPNVPGWVDHALGDELTARLGARVTVENDANAAAWGEFRVGAAREVRSSAAMVTVGTGVGGGLVDGGRLVRGANGLAAEFGHVVVAEGGPRCECGNEGCLEALASGTAIGRTARDARAAGEIPPSSPLARLPVDEVTGAAVTEAAVGGDDSARRVLRTCGAWLGVGLAGLANALDPEMIVIGGGGASSGSLLLDPAREALSERLLGRRYRQAPRVVPSALGEDSGMIGAALLALERP